jgi:hypothetical protein
MLVLNRFRNYFAHTLRLLWWHRKDNTKVFYFSRELYEKVMNGGSDGREEVYKMLLDTRLYEENIMNADTTKLISSREIIDDYHSKMGEIFNLTFGYIQPAL